MMGPHFSLADGQDCYTAAVAVDTAEGREVLCADLVFSRR